MCDEYEDLTCTQLVERILQLSTDETDAELFDEIVDWFLFTYSPEHAFSLVQLNQEALRSPRLLELWNGKIHTAFEPEIFLEGLNMLSSVENSEIAIAKSGAVSHTLSIMIRHAHIPRSQVMACKLLANLCSNTPVRNWIGKLNGPVKVLECLRRLPAVSEVVAACYKALINMTYHDKHNKEIIIAQRGVEAILEAQHEHKTQAKMVFLCLSVLRNIVSAGILELQQHLLIREILMMMSDHAAISGIQVNAIWTLINLMSSRPGLKEHIVEQGGLKEIFEALDTHLLNSQVQSAGATALALLLKRASNRMEIYTRGGVRALIVAIQEHRYHVGVQRACLKALFRISFLKDVRDNLGEEIASEVIETMCQHSQHGTIQRASILCLRQLSKSLTCRDQIQRDALSLMLQAMKRFQGVSLVYKTARKAVEVMIQGNEDLIHEEDKDKSDHLLRIELGEIRNIMEERNKFIMTLQKQMERLQAQNEKLELRVTTLGEKYKETRKEKIKAYAKVARLDRLETKARTEGYLEELLLLEATAYKDMEHDSFLAAMIAKQKVKINKELQYPLELPPPPTNSSGDSSEEMEQPTKPPASKKEKTKNSGQKHKKRESGKRKNGEKHQKKKEDLSSENKSHKITNEEEKDGSTDSGEALPSSSSMDRSYSSPSRVTRSSSKRILLQKRQHDPEKIAIAKRLFQDTGVEFPYGKGEIRKSYDLLQGERPRTGTPMKEDKKGPNSPKLNRHRLIRSINTRDTGTELELLKQEISQLKKGMEGLELELVQEKKEKEHLQTVVKQTSRTMRNSQTLISQLQKETLQSTPQGTEVKDKDRKKSREWELQKKLKMVEKENHELKKEVEQLKLRQFK